MIAMLYLGNNAKKASLYMHTTDAFFPKYFQSVVG